jgi:selenide,water dikinase
MRDDNLIVGMERPDDAGVYRISDDCALILTLDFFTPIVDDPYDFGQIAVANALSDVYAMGGTPLLAMNIICFPAKNLDASILHEILRGGSDKMQEAAVLLVGGHSVDDNEIKYGLSVTGTVHPDRVLRNAGAKPGDAVILTKPLGTGIISTALKAEMADETAVKKITGSMKELNRKPAGIMKDFPVSACTDVTGFGLIGHAAEMVEGTGTGMTIFASQVPFFPEALVYADMGLIPGGAYRNREFRALMTETGHGIEDAMINLLHDPQTSGGLLISLPGRDAHALLAALHEQGVPEAAIIGEVTDSNPGRILVKP